MSPAEIILGATEGGCAVGALALGLFDELYRSAIDHHRQSRDTGQYETGQVFSLGAAGTPAGGGSPG